MKITICKSALLCGAVAAFALASQAQAQNTQVSYDYLEISATQGEILDTDFTGYSATASFSLSDSVFMSASYSDGETDDKIGFGFGASKVEARGFDFGFGYHMPISSSTDFVTRLSYVRAEAEYAGFSDDANGYGVDLGVRSFVLPNLELEALAVYSDGSDMDGEVGLNINAKFFITPAFALIVGYSDGDDTNGVSAGLRFNFK